MKITFTDRQRQREAMRHEARRPQPDSYMYPASNFATDALDEIGDRDFSDPHVISEAVAKVARRCGLDREMEARLEAYVNFILFGSAADI
jgi:hypothetical protein